MQVSLLLKSSPVLVALFCLVASWMPLSRRGSVLVLVPGPFVCCTPACFFLLLVLVLPSAALVALALPVRVTGMGLLPVLLTGTGMLVLALTAMDLGSFAVTGMDLGSFAAPATGFAGLPVLATGPFTVLGTV